MRTDEDEDGVDDDREDAARVEHVEPLRTLEEAAEEPERGLDAERDGGDHGGHLSRALLGGSEVDHLRQEPRDHEAGRDRHEPEHHVDRQARRGEGVDLLGGLPAPVEGGEADDGRGDPEVEQPQHDRHRADEEPRPVPLLADRVDDHGREDEPGDDRRRVEDVVRAEVARESHRAAGYSEEPQAPVVAAALSR